MKATLQIGIFAIIIVLFAVPIIANSADDMANEQCQKSNCVTSNPTAKQPLCSTITCTDITGTAKTTGKCVSRTVCRADSTNSGKEGDSGMKLGDLSQLFGALSKLMEAFKGGQQSGSGSGSGTGATGGMPQGCTQYYQVSTPSSDPCAYYVPQTSSSLTTDGILGTGSNPASSLIDAIGGTGAGSGTGTTGGSDISGEGDGGDSGTTDPVSGLLDSTNTNANDNENDSTNVSGGTIVISSTTGSAVVVQGSNGQPSLAGDIILLGKGVTAVVMNPNAQGNSVVAGFYGTDAFGSAPESVAAQWCRTRPWAKNFLSAIIPPTFFDNLCTLRGFPVGEPAATTQSQTQTQGQTPSVVLTKNPPAQSTVTTTTVMTIPPSPPMQADIWAVPATVRLGARTTVFWNSKNAITCAESASDGNFTQNSLTGGAATVPLAGPTTFFIACVAPDGSTIENSVRVNLSY